MTANNRASVGSTSDYCLNGINISLPGWFCVVCSGDGADRLLSGQPAGEPGTVGQATAPGRRGGGMDRQEAGLPRQTVPAFSE